MKMQNRLNHNIKEDSEELDRVSENCNMCGIEMINIKDIRVDENDNYLCQDCCKYYNINAKVCKEI